MRKINILLVISVFLVSISCRDLSKEEKRKPNIIFILSDDLAWGDLGCYGQEQIETQNIDRLAVEGIKFTQAYCGNSVCAPSRSSLMQGKHPGHARVRGNSYKSYRESLQDGDFTVAMLLQNAGYKTGLFGKWGLSLYNQPGIPNNMGFDEFFGYLNQRQAHCFYPEFLYHNQERIYYPENGEFYKIENYKTDCVYNDEGMAQPVGIENPINAKYSFDIYCEKSLEFVRKNKDQPFFLYLAYTIPHGVTIVPDLGKYKDKDWPVRAKEYGAMVTRMDNEVGRLLNLLKELDLDNNTIIFFASDNGSYESDHPMVSFFNSAPPTRGNKGNSYDGAFHVPAMVRWPGHIEPNQESDLVWAFWDFLPTAAEIAEIDPPSDIDGISILPTLLGSGTQKQHDYLYWEFNQNQAVREGKWFAHRANGGKIELYDLTKDPQQTKDVGIDFPDVVDGMEDIMINAHTPSDVWPSPGESQQDLKKRQDINNIPERPDNVGLF